MATIFPSLTGSKIKICFARTYRIPFAGGADQIQIEDTDQFIGTVKSSLFVFFAAKSGTLREINFIGRTNLTAPATFDVNRNGVSIFGNPADRPVMPAGQRTLSKTVSQQIALFDEISIDVDSLGVDGITAPFAVRLVYS